MSALPTNDVSVVGVGKLGACLGASLSNAGFAVRGIDIDEDVVDSINAGKAPVTEPLLDEYVSAPGNEFTASTTYDEIASTDVTFIVVNTPSSPEGRYSLEYVERVTRAIGAELAEKDDYHLVVLTSTVFPGSTAGPVVDWLEASSGKRVGEEIGLCYSPEFIAIGDVIEGLESPDFFLVGEESERAGDVLEQIYHRIRRNDAPVVRMEPVEAEIAKMAVNSYVTMKISFANTLAQICDGVGGDVDVVTDALTHDSRISGEYLTAGARYGGPCFPRDNRAFSRLATDAGTTAPLAVATDEVNDRHSEWIADHVRRVTPAGGTVAVLGLTYKPGTYMVRESQGSALVETLSEEFDLQCYDPMGGETASAKLSGHEFELAPSIESAVAGADSAVVTVPWDEFEEYEFDSSLPVVDPWRLLDSDRAGEEHVAVGIGENPPEMLSD